jgi:hypothetical protein
MSFQPAKAKGVVQFRLIKVLLSAETAYPIYIGCNALQNELSKKNLEDNFGE